jgi:hypothetical protein
MHAILFLEILEWVEKVVMEVGEMDQVTIVVGLVVVDKYFITGFDNANPVFL